jgi:hypothetical protein
MTLLTELARLLRRMDPMPPRVLADALAAGALLGSPAAGSLPVPRESADELLVLAESVPAVRSPGRRLRIGHPGEPLLELEIRPLGPIQRIAGLAPAAARLTIRHEDGDHDVHVDGNGYFNAEVPAGRVRFRLGAAESGWV